MSGHERATVAAVLEVYERHRDVHPYGIADVVQFPDGAAWYRSGEAVVGVVPVPGSPTPVVYAVAHDRPTDAATLDLLDALAADLPGRFVIHGPRGLHERLAARFATVWHNDYVKLALARPEALPPADRRVRTLGRADVPALEDLYATDGIAGDFFHAGLVDTGAYVGIGAENRLDAAAGVHVLDETHRVAALANVATRPDRRRRGLGRAVVTTLVHHLRGRVETIGLNVRESNAGARHLYATLGFDQVTEYAEAELVSSSR